MRRVVLVVSCGCPVRSGCGRLDVSVRADAKGCLVIPMRKVDAAMHRSFPADLSESQQAAMG
jgi:hypothetical protein